VGSMTDLPAVSMGGIAHGGRLNQARRLFPNAPEPFLDLSTGINPLAYPLPDLSPECFTRLPEPEAEAALLAAAATAYGAADASLIAAAPGTQILIDLIPLLWPASGVVVLGPTYAEYAQAWRNVGAGVIGANLTGVGVTGVSAIGASVSGAGVAVASMSGGRVTGGRVTGVGVAVASVTGVSAISPSGTGVRVIGVTDFADLETAARRESGIVVVLCNPNNPDGRRIEPARLLELADRLAAGGGLLLVDEAFADLEDDGLSLVPSLPHPAVIVLRSFGKTYGLAGVRLGFAIAAPDRARRISSALGPWAVSGPAIAIARAALADRGWLAATRRRLDRETVTLDAMLSRAGLRVIGGTALFRLSEGPKAASIFQRLGRAGIAVRRFAEQPNWLRFGVPGSPEAWRRLDAALAD
jgi:histidinol-phosphate/aromatic aminotransferase/cobyric acid decarboxylase-like protein